MPRMTPGRSLAGTLFQLQQARCGGLRDQQIQALNLLLFQRFQQLQGLYHALGAGLGNQGEPAELGKNRTLRFSELPQRPEFPVFQLAALPPNVIAGQVDVLPAQWRKVLQ